MSWDTHPYIHIEHNYSITGLLVDFMIPLLCNFKKAGNNTLKYQAFTQTQEQQLYDHYFSRRFITITADPN